MNPSLSLCKVDNLRAIADEGFLTSLFLPDPSLAGGKTGAAVFLALLAQKTDNRNFADFAETLLEKTCESLTSHMPVGFSYGLCGIGWSIELLRQRGFLDVDTDNVLQEIDLTVMERDVRRMGDLSLESGLKGIAAYVSARLASRREPTDALPFDQDYLSELKERLSLEGMDSTLESYSIESIWTEYLDSIDACNPDLPFWQRGLLLLEGKDANRISSDKEVKHRSDPSVRQDKHKDLVIIFTPECLGLKYGIGSYIQTLIDAIDRDAYLVMTVRLSSERYSINEYDGLIMIDIPPLSSLEDKETTSEANALSCLHFIAAHMPEARNVVCHFNLYGYTPLIRLLKEYFSASAILTVHYTHFGIELKGDWLQMKRLLSSPNEASSDVEKDILESFRMEKATMEICDTVIAPSPHTMDYLTDLYRVPQEKILMIPHAPRSLPCVAEDKSSLRRKFGIPEKDIVILYVGRISRDKGVYDLLEAMKTLMAEQTDIRLIIAGGGELQKAYRHAAPYFTRITFTGFLQPEELACMYQLADIGVVPSHYEEFGYVALEMASVGLPAVVSDAGALPSTTEGFDRIHRFTSGDSVSLIDAIRRAMHDIEGTEAARRDKIDMSERTKAYRDAMNRLYRFQQATDS
ncbi:MAG: glycosyltransferase [Muribaculaceae bacterium]|nr:glycosyltransferase [Muribaculaceae bacterium]